MADLISRSALLDRLTTERFAHYHTVHTDTASLVQHDQEFNVCMGIVFDFPAVDAEPVRHGRWIENFVTNYKEYPPHTYKRGYKCSLCGRTERTNKEPYCHCGAKMDAEVEGC